jgi:hypothetical protein
MLERALSPYIIDFKVSITESLPIIPIIYSATPEVPSRLKLHPKMINCLLSSVSIAAAIKDTSNIPNPIKKIYT